MRRDTLLSRIAERYRRLGLSVSATPYTTRLRVEGTWVRPDFCVRTRAGAIVRVGFVEPGPRLDISRIERWSLASQNAIDVVVHCPRFVASRVEWMCRVKGLDLDIRTERA